METTTGCMANFREPINYTTIPNGSFRISYPPKKSKTLEFLDDVYADPPKFRVKWSTIDELHDDLFMSYNYRVLNHRLPFIEVLTGFFQTDEQGTIEKTKYSLPSYINGYWNKISSTQIYKKQATKLQEILQPVPVYAILNGQGEIVVATSTDSRTSNNPTVNEAVYDFCGSFDHFVERSKQLGLFFMSKGDAEVYLKEIAKADTQGTKMFGLSIHCFGLDYAYRVTREYHPTVDFRFVPDLGEVQTLMTSQNTSNSDLIFEDSQQQLRFRRRPISLIPTPGNFIKWLSPFSSFLEKTEYFKGVPIYVVKVGTVPNNFFLSRYYDAVNIVDNLYGRLTNFLNIGCGFGNNWILQGSLSQQDFSATAKTYIFFKKDEATQFCQRYVGQVLRYNGSRSPVLSSTMKKPKILVYNLEDFLEIYEESRVTLANNSDTLTNQASVLTDQPYIIPPKQTRLEVDEHYSQTRKPLIRKCQQFFDFKYRRLMGFIDILLNTN